mmetsp:Transcript_11371/g.27998  ORF Transcript_11371/g.27998 Transcript_11371/m.27998 type:complete len:146 (+) Transcript_11371:1392-1829(+)
MGLIDGSFVGWSVGSSVGPLVGSSVGSSDGLMVGALVGSSVGRFVGLVEGSSVGRPVGPVEEFSVGSLVGRSNGLVVGICARRVELMDEENDAETDNLIAQQSETRKKCCFHCKQSVSIGGCQIIIENDHVPTNNAAKKIIIELT